MAAHCASTNTWRSAQPTLPTTLDVINLRYATPDVHRINGRSCCGFSFADTRNEARPFAMISSESCIDCVRLPRRQRLYHLGQCLLSRGLSRMTCRRENDTTTTVTEVSRVINSCIVGYVVVLFSSCHRDRSNCRVNNTL